ncbi:MAG: response regulator [Bacteriovoracaceae bacterium]|nr:response regulator [Bacteriovoracaceae bacterium]
MASRILVVDDEIDIQNILVEFISVKFDVIIDSVNSGKEALDKIKKKKYNLLITDIRMSDVDGITLITTLKKNTPEMAENQPDNIWIMSGHITSEQCEVLTNANCIAMQKPLDLKQLEENLDDLFPRKKSKK